MHVYIDVKTELHSACICAVAVPCEVGFALMHQRSGEFLFRLPETIRVLPGNGIVYEDNAIRVRA